MSLPNIVYSKTNISMEWSITGIKTRNQDGRDVIVYLDWEMKGTRLDSADSPVSISRSGTIVLDYNPANFINLTELSQSKLVNWVNVKLGVDKINSLRKELEIDFDALLLTSQEIPA
jgi:UPF0288 family protein (methanogenesis marker protein 3)